MRNFLNLTPFQPGDSRINTAPVQNALEAYGAKTMQFDQIRRQGEEQQYQRGRDQKQDARQAESDKFARVERFGKIADAVDQLQGPQRQAAWQRFIQSHGADGLSPEEMDPMTGPALLRAQAGQVAQTQDRNKIYEVGNRLVQAGPGGNVREIYSAPEKPDPVREMLLRRLSPQPQGQQPQAGVAPMSAPGGAPNDGRLILANEQNQPQSMPVASAQDTNQIDTPFGRMSREEAQQLGGTMLLDPKYANAGKAILDSLQAGKGELSKPAASQLEESTISAAKGLGRLQSIKQQFKPEFQQIPNKLKLMGASWGAAVGAPLSPELQKNLADFSRYKATAFDNFNQLLKELSGTAVSAQELQRQKFVQPNPGEGLFDGDDPVTFQAKIDQGEKIFKAAIARMNFLRNRGLNFNKDTAEQFLRLEDVPAAMDRRGDEIEQELRRANPTADPTAIEREALSRVRQEFGI